MTESNEQLAYEIPQRILVLRDFCIRANGSTCAACGAACPHHALSFSEETPPSVDNEACTFCCICQGVCDAFTSTSNTLVSTHAAMRRIGISKRTCIITCETCACKSFALASNVISAPCLAMLPAELWCALLAEGINLAVSVDFERCNACSRAGSCATTIYGNNIAQAETWTQRSVGFVEELPLATDEGPFASLANAGEGGDRRALFTDVLAQLKDAASGNLRLRTDEKLQTLREQNQRLAAYDRLNLGNGTQFNSFVPLGRTRTIMGQKRKLLLQALNLQPDIANRIELPLPTTNTSSCSDCLQCTRRCPTGARLPNAADGSLNFDWRYCIGCGLCEQACPNDAITLTNTFLDTVAC